jgi:hypothetical protein
VSLVPIIESRLNGNSITLDEKTISDIEALLDDIEDKATYRLKVTIKFLRGILKNKKTIEGIGIFLTK